MVWCGLKNSEVQCSVIQGGIVWYVWCGVVRGNVEYHRKCGVVCNNVVWCVVLFASPFYLPMSLSLLLALTCLILSLVTQKCFPISSSVIWLPSASPNRISTICASLLDRSPIALLNSLLTLILSLRLVGCAT